MSRSLLPALLGMDLWNDWDYPSRLFDRSDDLFSPRVYGYVVMPRQHSSRQLSTPTGLSEVASTSDKFLVSVDVSHFNPEDISVKTVDNFLVIHAKHEERADEHGFISREFTRRYLLPDDIKPESVMSSMSSDGVLTVEAPKIKGDTGSNERVIPITRKEVPSAVTERPEARE